MIIHSYSYSFIDIYIMQLPFQVPLKLFVFIKRRDVILANINSIKTIYSEYASPMSENFSLIRKYSLISLNIVRSLSALYIIVCLILYFSRGFADKLNGKPELFLPYFIPFLDRSTLLGIWLSYLIQAYSMYFGATSVAIGDILFSNMSLHSLLFPGIIRNEFEQINALLLRDKAQMEAARKRIRKIILIQSKFMK